MNAMGFPPQHCHCMDHRIAFSWQSVDNWSVVCELPTKTPFQKECPDQKFKSFHQPSLFVLSLQWKGLCTTEAARARVNKKRKNEKRFRFFMCVHLFLFPTQMMEWCWGLSLAAMRAQCNQNAFGTCWKRSAIWKREDCLGSQSRGLQRSLSPWTVLIVISESPNTLVRFDWHTKARVNRGTSFPRNAPLLLIDWMDLVYRLICLW